MCSQCGRLVAKGRFPWVRRDPMGGYTNVFAKAGKPSAWHFDCGLAAFSGAPNA